MLFNSYFFIFSYLPVVLGAFFTCCYFNMRKAAQRLLLLSSLFFYAYWDVRFLPLLCGSMLFNFTFGHLLSSTFNKTFKRYLLITSISFNIGLLLYFKYLNFFISSVGYLLSQETPVMEILLPLGISFFTFTQIAYLVDVYQEKAIPGEWDSYGLFVTVFPHLIAGPVLHHKEMMQQFENPTNYRWSSFNFAQGAFLFVMGLFKKVMIADQLFPLVSPVFDQVQLDIPFIQAWIGALGYSLELYFDFSGYSDMAIGLGLLFNIRLPVNFQSPYQADSIIDFWRRWHISLSNFLKDYLYIPLGGNRRGESSKLCNLLITMLLGGIWHGANWTFILWGASHGLFLVINHLWRKLKISLPRLISQGLTLFCVIVAFAVFRSPDLKTAWIILKGLFGLNGIVLPISYSEVLGSLSDYGVVFKNLPFSNARISDILLIIITWCVALFLPNSLYWKDKFLIFPRLSACITAVAFTCCVLHLDAVTEFLYYQF